MARYANQPAGLVNASDLLQYRPVRLNGVELAEGPCDSFSPHLPGTSSTPALADLLDDVPTSDGDVDPTVLAVDRNHEYTVWLSYSEVYNEKVYDLFAAIDAPDAPSPTPARTAGQSSIPRPTSSFLNLPLPASQSNPLLLTRKALAVKPCPPGEAAGDAGAGKYVAGLRQIRVESAAEAKGLLRLGQLHRRVFGTLANSQSSRSHALVTIKVLRVHRGEKNVRCSVSIVYLCSLLTGATRFAGFIFNPDGAPDARRPRGLRAHEAHADVGRAPPRGGQHQQVADGPRPVHGDPPREPAHARAQPRRRRRGTHGYARREARARGRALPS